MKLSRQSHLFNTILNTLVGLLVEGILLLAIGVNPLTALKVATPGVVGKPEYISWILIQAAPLILTSLSVAFAFNTGLFNIEAEGQLIVGSLAAVVVGILVPLPPVIHAIVATLAGMLAGVIWGGLVGFFKAEFDINGVVSSIMLNWVALYLSNLYVAYPFIRKPESGSSYDILESVSIKFLDQWKLSEAGKSLLEAHKVLKGSMALPPNWELILVIVCAITTWYILKCTSLGYELKAVGFDKDAAECGGINIEKSIIVSMTIAGALSGLTGAVMILGVNENTAMLSGQQNHGFNGITVSLIGANAPSACVPAGILFAVLTYGGGKLSSQLNTPSGIVSIIVGIIVFLIAMSKLFQLIRNYLSKGKGMKKIGEVKINE